jgi:hypothetical protein
VGSYDQLKQEIDRLVGEINGRFSQNDIFNWANTVLHAAITEDLSGFPRVGLFVPDSKPADPDKAG